MRCAQAKFSAAELEQLPRGFLASAPCPRAARSRTARTTSSSRSASKSPLVQPAVPAPGRTVYPDLYWPHLRLVVEVDSLEWHDDPLARHDDAERQAELEAAGERVLRFTKRGPAQSAPGLARLTRGGRPNAG